MNKHIPWKDYISLPLFIGKWKEFVTIWSSWAKKNLNMHKGSHKSVRYFQNMFKTHPLHQVFPDATH